MPVYVAPMSDADDKDDQLHVLNFIHYPIIAHSNAAPAAQLSFQGGADIDDLAALIVRYPKQVLLGASLDLR